MKHVIAVFVVVFALLAASWTQAQTRPDALAEVKAVLDAQVLAWNTGAAEEKNSVYYDSPEMLWVNRTGVRKGIAPVRASYRRPAVESSRRVLYSYEPLHMERLSPNCVYFVIRWRFEQGGRNATTGVTSLIWKKINRKWVIVAEHAS